MAAKPSNAPLVLIVRDGWGQNPNPEHNAFNAIHLAETKIADAIEETWPTTLIHTSGEDVGLPKGTMGNSEVGHQNIGAGRIVNQECMRITQAIRDGSLARNETLLEAFAHIRKTSGTLHLMGLVSDGRVHSDLEHLFALLEIAKEHEVPAERLVIHAFTDGRDTGPRTGKGFLRALEAKIQEVGVGCIGTVIGRYYAMDRDHRWERVAHAYACLTGRGCHPDGSSYSTDSVATSEKAAQRYYDNPSESNRQGDEFILPTRVGDGDVTIGDGDAVFFFNFRGDRPREITKAFVYDDDTWAKIQNGGFPRGERLKDLWFGAMSRYEKGLPIEVALERPPAMKAILGDVISSLGWTQFRCAETEKFPHVTFFFNDYREEPFPGERREIVPSPKDVSTYDQKPEMSAREVCDRVLARLGADDCEPLLVVNFANGDMVGHTGVLEAAKQAVTFVDRCVGEILEATLAKGGSLIVTADHGNSEQMWDPQTEAPHTAHTTFDVPITVIGEGFRGRRLRTDGRLADIAPTILAMLGVEIPAEMDGRSLLE